MVSRLFSDLACVAARLACAASALAASAASSAFNRAAASAAVREIAPILFGLPVHIPAPGEYVGIGAARQQVGRQGRRVVEQFRQQVAGRHTQRRRDAEAFVDGGAEGAQGVAQLIDQVLFQALRLAAQELAHLVERRQVGNVDQGQRGIEGVGQLAGTVYAALGLGVLSKLLEGWTGAVLAKIAVLVFIIIFIQKRPQGIFAMKGRSAEA